MLCSPEQKVLIMESCTEQGPKIRFNFYNIKTDICVFHFILKVLLGIISLNKSDKHLERRY